MAEDRRLSKLEELLVRDVEVRDELENRFEDFDSELSAEDHLSLDCFLLSSLVGDL